MKRFFLAVILGFYLMVVLEDMTLAVDIPAPQFNQPADSPLPSNDAPTYTRPGDGAVPGQTVPPVNQDNNVLKCAADALTDKFPFDFFGVFDASPNASAACPRIIMFEGTSAAISFEMCFVLNAIALLKYPILIGLSVSVIINL